jgi:hypothetical protein
MVKWRNTCLPGDWGVGIINIRILNVSLLLKWVWRVQTREESDMCCESLHNKYLWGGSIANCKTKGGSQFWQGISKVKHKFQWGRDS